MPDLPETIDSSVIYDGALIRVRVDTIRMNGGVIARREIIDHPGAVCMLPVTSNGQLLLVTQYRHAARQRLLELPAGTLEPGEDPVDTAIRECQEEVGMRPATVEPLGGFYVAPGYTSEYIYLYVCSGLEPAPLDGDDDEDIDVVHLSLGDALAAIEDGRIVDAKSIVGILRWSQRNR